MAREALLLLVLAAASGLAILALADGIAGGDTLPIQPLDWLIGLVCR